MEAPPPAWSEATEEADWIAERLAPFRASRVTSVVPEGFEAYARILHPAEEPRWGRRLVRWAEVAAWSGTALRADVQFHSVALPPFRPAGEAPWSSQGPRVGSLWRGDAEVLAGVLRGWTTTPEDCRFCVWDGYGWDRRVALTATTNAIAAHVSPEGSGTILPDPIPESVRKGRRVELPQRSYFLYAGPTEAALSIAGTLGEDQTPNLWWPKDRAWCVASEIDLAWSYVGGPSGLLAELLSEARLEVLPARGDEPLVRVEPWVRSWAEEAATSLLATGKATITTSRGRLRAELEPPDRRGRAVLRVRHDGDNGVSGNGNHMIAGERDELGLSEAVARHLSYDLIGLVGS